MPKAKKATPRVSFTAKLPEQLILEMKIQALLEKRDASDIIEDAVWSYLAKLKKKGQPQT